MISVIIPTRNRCLLLKKVIDSLIDQSLSKEEFEILVIDNGSTDKTLEIVEEYKFKLANLRCFHEANPGLHCARHRGFKEAKGELLVFADDDIEAMTTWLDTIKNCFKDKEIVLVGGKNLPKFESSPPDWLMSMWQPNNEGERILGYLSILDFGEKPRVISPHNIFGCNFAIRREILVQANGFHPDSMPQELIHLRGDGESHVSQYVLENKLKAFYHPLASVYHWVPSNRMTVDYFCKRAYNQGISDSYTQIRKLRTSKPSSHKNKSGELTVTFLRRFVRLFSKHISVPTELEQIKIKINGAYNEGFLFHQTAVKNDPELLKWVLRPDYWD